MPIKEDSKDNRSSMYIDIYEREKERERERERERDQRNKKKTKTREMQNDVSLRQF